MTKNRTSLDLDWEVRPQSDGIDPSKIAIYIARAIQHAGRVSVQKSMPDLLQYFPFDQTFHFQAHFSKEGWFGLRVIFVPGPGMTFGPSMKIDDVETLVARVEPFYLRTPKEVHHLLGSDWFGEDRFTYVGPYQGHRISQSDLANYLSYWVEDILLPTVLQFNEARVRRAIPSAPNYEIDRFTRALWVLECEEEVKQGTAFALEGVGLVTCDHVVGKATRAFQFSSPEKKVSVKVISRHAVVDLAIIAIDCEVPLSLKLGDPSLVKQMDHVLVLGHPNYRIGDSPIASPGLIVGFRTRSGIRRLLTNAAIVSGCSGGPAIDRDGNVIGIAVTGADSFARVPDTEDISIIPVDALSLLPNPVSTSTHPQ